MKKVLVVAATQFEIQPFIHFLSTEMRQKQSIVFRNYEFDVLITADVNLYHQNKVSQFDLAVVVLRAYRNAYEFIIDTVPEALEVLQAIQPGQVVYVWANERLCESDRRKGKGPFKAE